MSDLILLILNKIETEIVYTATNCLGGVVDSMYGCTPGGPGFEFRVGPSLVIESFCIVSLNNSPIAYGADTC
ncbi:unnamed protein product, partial [Brenthis ino]